MLHFEVFIPKLLLFNIFRQFVLQKFILSKTYISVAVYTSIHNISTDPSTQHIATWYFSWVKIIFNTSNDNH